jgi:hypothetical protein
MFTWINRKTDNTSWVRFPAACAFIASNIVKTATRTTNVVETFLYGSKMILNTPFSEQKIENLKNGITEISIETPKNIARLFFVIVEIFIDCIYGVLIEPKYYIIASAGSMEVNLEHAKKGTIGSLKHKEDSKDASETFKEKLLNYQKSLN